MASLIACVMYAALVGLRLWKTISSYFWADLAELYYETLGFLFQFFITIYHVLPSLTCSPSTSTQPPTSTR